MGLSRIRIGDLIKVVDERNTFGFMDYYGLNINKDFMPTVANTDGLDETKYKVVRKNRFVFSGMQTGRDKCIRIGMYLSDKPVIVSPAYTTFEVEAIDWIDPTYLYMIFQSREMDRRGWFYSDGSIRSNLDWERLCDIELRLPKLSIQKKYVDIYKAMVANQQSYERGLEDLKLACDSYFDEAKNKGLTPLGDLIERIDVRNECQSYTKKDVKGITNNKEFSETRADVSDVDLSKFKIVKKGQFAYNSRTDGRDMLVLALNRDNNPIIVTFNYNVFGIRKDKTSDISADYMYAFFKRLEFDRRVRFNSWGSSQELLSWDSLCEIKIPVPRIGEQMALASIMNSFLKRKEINEKMKQMIKDNCPILIRGSLEDGG